MNQKSSPHGKCRIITDPAEIKKAMERLGRKYVPRQPAPCSGNTITLTIAAPSSDKKEQRTFSDSDLAEILRSQRTAEGNPRCTKKQLSALDDFRRRLSKKGEEWFTERQKAFLAIIIQTSEGNNPTSEKYEEAKKQVSALLRLHMSKQGVPRKAVEDFFSRERVLEATAEVVSMLEPHSIPPETASKFVYACGAQMMERFFWVSIEGGTVPKKAQNKAILRSLMNRELDVMLGNPLDLANVPKKLSEELINVPENSPEMVLDILEHVIVSFSGSRR